jgi:hypothetical protein
LVLNIRLLVINGADCKKSIRHLSNKNIYDLILAYVLGSGDLAGAQVTTTAFTDESKNGQHFLSAEMEHIIIEEVKV